MRGLPLRELQESTYLLLLWGKSGSEVNQLLDVVAPVEAVEFKVGHKLPCSAEDVEESQ